MEIKETTTERTFQINLNEEEMRCMVAAIGSVSVVAFEDMYKHIFETPTHNSLFCQTTHQNLSDLLNKN